MRGDEFEGMKANFKKWIGMMRLLGAVPAGPGC